MEILPYEKYIWKYNIYNYEHCILGLFFFWWEVYEIEFIQIPPFERHNLVSVL